MKKTALALFLLALLLVRANAKEYSLEKAEVFYEIKPDGLVQATESITFNFSGSFSYAFRTFPKGSWQINSIKVFEGNKELDFRQTDLGHETELKWFYSAQNEKKTFTIKYELQKAVTTYTDVGEFYWKVWGQGWSKPLNELYGEIRLPGKVEDANQVYSWGHPELNGKIGLVGNQTLIFQAFEIPKEQWVEIRLLFPRELLQGTENALEKKQAGLEKIIEEEKQWTTLSKE